MKYIKKQETSDGSATPKLSHNKWRIRWRALAGQNTIISPSDGTTYEPSDNVFRVVSHVTAP
eukprot:12146347-Heterocapsa_arctica.AAC.1